MTPAEAAARLGMDPRRIRAWLRRHHGAAPGGRWVIDEATFAALGSSPATWCR